MKKCECGCGTEVKEDKRIVNGHFWKGKHLSDNHKKNIKLHHADFSGENSPMFGRKNKWGHHSDNTKLKMSNFHKGKILSEKTKKNIGVASKFRFTSGQLNYTGKNHPNFGKKFSKEQYPKYGWRTSRKSQVFPVKDTSIEVKIQNLLKQLHIEFVTHQYIKEIEHGYQVDFIIPIQEGITKKTIIETYGNYWHSYPCGREIDVQRCQELREKGWRVLIFWENEIKVIELNDLKLRLTYYETNN